MSCLLETTIDSSWGRDKLTFPVQALQQAKVQGVVLQWRTAAAMLHGEILVDRYACLSQERG